MVLTLSIFHRKGAKTAEVSSLRPLRLCGELL